MLRSFGAFLLIFALLGLVIHIHGAVELFGGGAVAFFGIDFVLRQFSKDPGVLKGAEDLLLP